MKDKQVFLFDNKSDILEKVKMFQQFGYECSCFGHPNFDVNILNEDNIGFVLFTCHFENEPSYMDSKRFWILIIKEKIMYSEFECEYWAKTLTGALTSILYCHKNKKVYLTIEEYNKDIRKFKIEKINALQRNI